MLPIAPFPPPSLLSTIPADAYTAWTAALSLHLQLPSSKFASQSLTDPTLCSFLHTYLHAAPSTSTTSTTTSSSSSTSLKRKVLTLLHRILTLPESTNLPPSFTSTQFLRDLSATFPRSHVLHRVLDEERVWRRFEATATRLKRVVVAARGTTPAALTPLFRLSRRTAEVFLAGDEWVEIADVREFMVAVVEVAGRNGDGDGARKPNWSLVTDTVYGLVAAAGKAEGVREGVFLKALVETTVVVAALRRCARGTPEEGRVDAMLKALEKFGRPKVKRVGKEKGKRKMVGLSEEDEMAAMRRVADIREIFPDLGSGFVRRCLDALDNDVERVTSALLEENLPPGLQHADRSEE